MDEITITLPLPFWGLNPNDRAHRQAEARAVKAYRRRAEMEARRIPASRRQRWARAETQAVFYFAVVRRRDEDNAAASLKPAWDGLADAEVVENDVGLTHERPRLLLDPTNPRVELTIRPLP